MMDAFHGNGIGSSWPMGTDAIPMKDYRDPFGIGALEMGCKENYVDHFHWLNNTGLLDVEDVQA